MSFRAYVLALAAVFLLPSGCGEKEDYQARYLDLRERHNREIASLKSQQEQQAKEWRRQIGAYEERLGALRDKLAGQEGTRFARSGNQAFAETSAATRATDRGEVSSRINAQTGTALETTDDGAPAVSSTDKLLEAFLKDYAPRIEEGRREAFTKDFTAYIANLREDASATDSQARERMLGSLQSKLAAATSEREREELQRRLETIRNVPDEDLAQVLVYYQQLDDYRGLERLMDDYNISREELRLRGVEPPPQDTWGPDAKEIAYNLRNFIDAYAPLTNPSQREEYRQDFEKCLSALTSRPTDEQVRQRQGQMLAELEEMAGTASEEEKARLERRMQALRNADPDDVRMMAQGQNLRELSQLVEKYGIPADELRRSGVLLPRVRSPGRPRR